MTSTSSFSCLNASRRPSKLGYMLIQEKIDEVRRLTPGQRQRVALKISDAATALYRAGAEKR
jgi:hypothetical protein